MLYQQGTQRIEVIVKREGGGSLTNANEVEPENINSEESLRRYKLFGSANPEREARVIKTNTLHALAVGKQVVTSSIDYYINGLGYKTGDQSYQDLVQREFEIFKDTTGFASSVAMGRVYGAWGGHIGSVLGTLFGATTSLVSIILKYAGREREFNYKVFKENNAIEYQRARASINMTTGRLR